MTCHDNTDALCGRLRRDHGVMGGIPILLSTEKPRCQLVSMVDMENGNPLDYQVQTDS